MKKIIPIVITISIVITGIVFGLIKGIHLSPLQKETLLIVSIIAGVSALYCFIVGELAHNNSQMDKLWSILPGVYTWVVYFKSDFKPRLLIMAIIVTLWCIRLTYNFARKGAYKLKFWQGEEDYRWAILRSNSVLKNKYLWMLFDLLFISIYQNLIVLLTTLPSIAVMESVKEINYMDFVAMGSFLFFLAYETISDEIQWSFQTTKYRLLKDKPLEELPEPYNLGFNTVGIWNYSRHPNYLGEQAIWVSFYLFVIAAKATHYKVFNWTIVGCLLLILLFLGSSTLAESISSKKYPKYEEYTKKVFKYLPLPFRKYR